MDIYVHLVDMTQKRPVMRSQYQETTSISSDSCHANTSDVSNAFELPKDVGQSFVLSGSLMKYIPWISPYLFLYDIMWVNQKEYFLYAALDPFVWGYHICSENIHSNLRSSVEAISNFFVDHQSMPEVFLVWAHHDINLPYAFRRRSSKVLPGNTSRLHINTKPEAPKSTPHPKWKVWQLSGNMVVEVIPGIDSNGMFIFQKGLVDRSIPIVFLHAASSPKQCQSVASQRWHFSLQLKPQLRWKALDGDNWQGKGSINELGIDHHIQKSRYWNH